ncbi:hypothetical protein [Demequina mangrovi]|uniref:hypothetical protein n=1 Tax=Demequina mangrovi TaxID=1043493 RepID=UPI00094566D8|nr:hypothetical protein [Demequina mangrovi]
MLGASVLMFAGWCWVVVLWARRWHDSRYWTSYRERLVDGFGEGWGRRASRAYPQVVFTLAPVVLCAAGAAFPLILGYARGEASPDIADINGVAGLVSIALAPVGIVVFASLWFLGKPQFLVPPPLRE